MHNHIFFFTELIIFWTPVGVMNTYLCLSQTGDLFVKNCELFSTKVIILYFILQASAKVKKKRQKPFNQ